MDFLLTEQRDQEAALRLLKQAIRRHGVPEKTTIDGRAAHEAAIKRSNEEHGTAIGIRKITYLNTMVEQDHQGVKRITRPMLGCKSFHAAQCTFTVVALIHMLRKGQRKDGVEQGLTTAAQFYALAAQSPHGQGQLPLQYLLHKICGRTTKPPLPLLWRCKSSCIK